MEHLESLLQRVSLLVKQEEDEMKASYLRGEQFNIFEVCGINHYELQHSAIIAEMINPDGLHGQGELYLKLFMQAYGTKLPIEEIEYDKVSVRKEEWTGAYDGRMDIYIEYDGLPLAIIENKLYAKDQSVQLKKYKENADIRIRKSPYPKHQYEIVYLTLDGRKATEDSGKGVEYIQMSYSRDIILWLDKCIEQSVKIPLVRETLIQYQNHIKQLTNQNMPSKEKEQLFKLLSKYPEETQKIQDILWDNEYKKYVFEHFVKEKIDSELSVLGLKVDFSDMPNGNGFYVYKESWYKNNNGFRIYFGDENKNHCGRKWVGIEADNKKIEKNVLESLKGDSPTEWWPFGTQWVEDEMDRWDWPSFTKNMVNGRFADYVISKVKAILKELEEKGISLD